MDRRLRALTWVLAAVSLASISVAGQAQSTWTAPKTPWGDPDVQGFFTNNDESGIPLERPDGFEGKGLDEVTDQELAELTEERNQRAEDRAALLGGLPGSNPVHWFENFGAQNSRAWLIVDPPDGRVPPMTAEAGRRPQGRGGSSFGNGPFDGPEDLSMYDRCITRGLPGSMMPAIYGNAYQIVQSPGYVAIRYEMVHETRVVPLDGSTHVGPPIRQFMGDARGHFEGDTLVIETTNFDPKSTYRNAAASSLRLVERFRAVAPDKVEWAVTVDDPGTWTRPWTFAMYLSRVPTDAQPFEYACHEGNYGLANLLNAARVADEKADDKEDK
jgi:hypothetical protein